MKPGLPISGRRLWDARLSRSLWPQTLASNGVASSPFSMGFHSADTTQAPFITKGMGKSAENVAGRGNLACYAAVPIRLSLL